MNVSVLPVVREFLKRAANCLPDGSFAARQSMFELLVDNWSDYNLRPGELVVFALPSTVELLDHFFAVLAAGGVPALVSPATPATRLRSLANVFPARAIVAKRPVYDSKHSEADATRQLFNTVVSFRRPTSEPITRKGEVVLVTSGTSGFASACVFGFDQLLTNAIRHVESISQGPDDVVLATLPLHFSFALVAQALGTLISGGTLLFAEPPFHVDGYRRILDTARITVSSITPNPARQVLHYNMPWPESLRALTIGGATFPSADVERLLLQRPGKELFLTYGLTQAGPRVSTLAAHAEPRHRFASVGRPLKGTTVRLRCIDDNVHELLVSSSTIMDRRLGHIEGRGSDWAGPRLLATGDVFDMGDDGYMYFKGRLSDFVLIKGEKVCLASVCRIACECRGIMSARAILHRSHDEVTHFDLEVVASTFNDNHIAAGVMKHLSRTLQRHERPQLVVVTHPLDQGSYK